VVNVRAGRRAHPRIEVLPAEERDPAVGACISRWIWIERRNPVFCRARQKSPLRVRNPPARIAANERVLERADIEWRRRLKTSPYTGCHRYRGAENHDSP
jgi:hypothetical protein